MANVSPIDNRQVDEYFLDTPRMRQFIADVRAATAQVGEIEAVLDTLQPRFAALLADQTWLPDEFAIPFTTSGMGGGIASWLLFRAGDRSLSLTALVVPPGAETPVHDHLAWGLVGLYRGEQQETVYALASDDVVPHAEHDAELMTAHLKVTEVNLLRPGDFYKLLPPDGDIHAVKTISAVASVSIHLLANDVGCVVRHAYDPAASTARPFRSGYSNVPCRDEDADN